MKVNAEGAQAPNVTSLQKLKEVRETKENGDDIDLGCVSEPLEEEPLEDLSVGSDDQNALVGDMPDEQWTELHSDEVQEMLDFEAEDKQYRIQHHYFTNRKLQFVPPWMQLQQSCQWGGGNIGALAAPRIKGALVKMEEILSKL